MGLLELTFPQSNCLKPERWNMRFFWIIFFCCIHELIAQQNWTVRNPYPTNVDLKTVAYGNGVYVAAGLYGTLVYSTDGLSWTKQKSGTIQNLNKVTFGSGLFVCVGNSGTIISSPDGVNWTNQSSGTNKSLLGISWGVNKFVAGGEVGTILTSPDGITWTKQSSTERGSVTSITWVNNQFIGATTFLLAGYYDVLCSPDGINWTINYSPQTFSGIAWGSNNLVGVAQTGKVASANGGVDWTTETDTIAKGAKVIIWTNGKFIATNGTQIFSSSDGILWSNLGSTPSNLLDLIWANNQFIGVGNGGAIISSPDGKAWLSHEKGYQNALYSVSWNGKDFAAVGDLGRILVSSDGTTWINEVSGTQRRLNSIASGQGSFVAVGDYGTICLSKDGTSWMSLSSENNNPLHSVIWGNGQFIAVGDSGTVLTSSTGDTWAKQNSGVNKNIYSIVWGNNKYIAIFDDTVLSSSDGVIWTKGTSSGSVQSIIWGNNQFLEFNDYGTILSSPDCLSWTQVFRNINIPFFSDGIWGGNQFVASISLGTSDTLIAISPDGKIWATFPTGSSWGLNGITYGNGEYVAVGYYGTILTSPATTAVTNPLKSVNEVHGQNSIQILAGIVHYSVSSFSLVSLCLYDIRGRHIKTLINTMQGPGAYSVGIPSKVSSGRYIISLKCNNKNVDKVIAISQ